MKTRHDELAVEMSKRFMNHKSPYTQPNLIDKYTPQQLVAVICKKHNIRDLSDRCSECKKRIEQFYPSIGEIK